MSLEKKILGESGLTGEYRCALYAHFLVVDLLGAPQVTPEQRWNGN